MLGALQRLAPAAVIRRAGRLFESPHDVDFVLDEGRGQVLVEVKSSNQPVTVGQLNSLRSSLPSSTALVLVSRDGFVNEVANPDLHDLYLATWRSADHDPELGDALNAALQAQHN